MPAKNLPFSDAKSQAESSPPICAVLPLDIEQLLCLAGQLLADVRMGDGNEVLYAALHGLTTHMGNATQ